MVRGDVFRNRENPARPLPGQRGLPTVAPDIPKDEWGGVFDLPFVTEPAPPVASEDRAIYCIIVPAGMRGDVEFLLDELAQSMGTEVVYIGTRRTDDGEETR